MYSEKVMEHFRNPHNMGEIENPDGRGKIGNPLCGDVMEITIKVGTNSDGKNIIKDIKFKTFGCAAAISTTSMVTDLAKGKTLEEAMKITTRDVAVSLGGLPPIKMHCSNMSADALRKAIADYESRKKKKTPAKKK